MTKRRSGKKQHKRTRDDHSMELAEDYVEAIAESIETNGWCRVSDLADHFGVSHVSVNRAVARLQRSGLVTSKPYGPVELTPEGVRLAKSSRRRHEIVYRFLLDLGVEEDTAATDSEGIEHHVSPETLRRMRAFSRETAARRKA